MFFYLRASVKIKWQVDKTPAAGTAPGDLIWALKC
jgi:hypothetical protein